MAVLAEDRPAFLTVYTHFLDWISHQFMPFHPPKMPDTSARDYLLYQGVVTGAYRLLDVLLADLLRAAGPEANVLVVSDHGFFSGDRRPLQTPRVAAGIAAWHHPRGLLVAWLSPAIRLGAIPLGAVLADITPTLLALFNLPIGSDLPGRVLAEILAKPPAPDHVVPSWELVPDAVAPPTAPAAPPYDDALLLRQFAQLGYLDPAVQRLPEAAATAARQNRWNLGLALFELGHAEAALPHLELCHWEEPESPQYAFHLARCQMHLGLVDEADKTGQTLLDFGETQPRALLLRAQLALAHRQPELTLALVSRLKDQPESAAECASFTRLALLRLGRFPAAARSFDDDVRLHPHHSLSWLGLAHARFRLGEFAGAIDAARQALALQPRLSSAYAILIQALEKCGHSAATPAVLEQLRRIFPQITPGQETQFLAPATEELVDRRLATLSLQTARTLQLRDQAEVRRRSFLEKRRVWRANYVPIEFTQPSVRAADPRADSLARGFYLLVSGAPRSGTSLMMRMLAFGGMPILTDGVRQPDEDNPLGYFEWQDAKRLPVEPTLVSAAAGKAVKIVSPLLQYLPADRIYHVIFLARPAEEIARSQAAMLARHGKISPLSLPDLTSQLAEHVTATMAWLRSAPHFRLLEIPFASLVDDPAALRERLVNFVGATHLPRPQSMARAVQPDLWRQRQIPAGPHHDV